MQDINTIIADFVNMAVERKVKEELQAITERLDVLDRQLTGFVSGSGTTLSHLLNMKIRVGTLEEDVIKLKANNMYTPDHVMARISYIEGHINNLPNEASIKQMIEDEIGESQQKVEDMIDDKLNEKLGTDLEDTVKEKIEQRLDDDLDDKIADALDDAITEGKITLTFMR
jgi:chemotaxis protein CheY-P-specific phosphatase CheC